MLCFIKICTTQGHTLVARSRRIFLSPWPGTYSHEEDLPNALSTFNLLLIAQVYLVNFAGKSSEKKVSEPFNFSFGKNNFLTNSVYPRLKSFCQALGNHRQIFLLIARNFFF